MDDTEIHRHIDELVAEEHRLERAPHRAGALRRRAGAAGRPRRAARPLLGPPAPARRPPPGGPRPRRRAGAPRQRRGGLPPVGAQPAAARHVAWQHLRQHRPCSSPPPAERRSPRRSSSSSPPGRAGCGWSSTARRPPGPASWPPRSRPRCAPGAGPRWWSTPPTSSAPRPCASSRAAPTRTRCCDGWLDDAALRREVLEPAAPGRVGPGAAPAVEHPHRPRLPRRLHRAPRRRGGACCTARCCWAGACPPSSAVHFRMSAAALTRTLPEDLRWTVPAHVRHEQERPEAAICWCSPTTRIDPRCNARDDRCDGEVVEVWARRELNPHVLTDTRT